MFVRELVVCVRRLYSYGVGSWGLFGLRVSGVLGLLGL